MFIFANILLDFNVRLNVQLKHKEQREAGKARDTFRRFSPLAAVEGCHGPTAAFFIFGGMRWQLLK